MRSFSMMQAVAAAAVSGALLGGVAQAQQGLLEDLYGNGAHAYFAGQPMEAYELLNTAIESGSQDPRTYYFRGLTFLQLGRPEEANADFERGAELEAAQGGGFYNVDRALERIQGSVRLNIERQRTKANIAAARKAADAMRAMQAPANASSPGTIPVQPNIPTVPSVPNDPNSSVDNPFEAPAGSVPAVPVPAAPMPAPAAPAPAEPEAEPAKPATPPADPANPFGQPATPPATPATPAPAGGNTPLPNPFEPAAEPAAPATPQADKPAPANPANPFEVPSQPAAPAAPAAPAVPATPAPANPFEAPSQPAPANPFQNPN